MYLKQVFFGLFLQVLFSFVHAQQAIQFINPKHNFGEIAEEGGLATHKFIFRNNSTEPILINNVQASCGCTTPEWSRDAIMPGKEGYVIAQYNPKGRPGEFIKTLSVITDKDGNQTLFIEGKVVPGAKVAPKPKEFVQTFRYNENTLVADGPKFQEFISSLLAKFEAQGRLNISLESSASHVPTRSFPSNEALSKSRADEAIANIKSALVRKGVKLENIKVNTPKILVQGPEYENDYDINYKVYEEFQYIKITVE